MSVEKVSAPCPDCGGVVWSIRIDLPSGSRVVNGECGVCADRAETTATRFATTRAAAIRIETCGAGEVTVWQGLEAPLAASLRRQDPGLVLVHGDMMSGKSTLARAWARKWAETTESRFARASLDIFNASRRDFDDLAPALVSVPRLAIDGVGDNESPIELWKADRLAEVLSHRHQAITLITIPTQCLVEKGALLAQRIGPSLARRIMLMLSRRGEAIRLRAEETCL